MDQTPFPLDLFLQRLGRSTPPLPGEQGLRELHLAQVHTWPFENIDPFLHRSVELAPSALYRKLLQEGRGGYCFELNTFFLHALRALGFAAEPRLGRVFMGRPQAGPRTHLVNLVAVGGRPWLADVGFGGPGLLEPIPFEAGFAGEQAGRKIRLRQDPSWGMLLEDEEEGKWRTIYALPEEKTEPVDVEVGNHYCSTHPQSIFRQSLYCAFPQAEGKITVLNRSVQWMEQGVRQEKRLAGLPDLSWLAGRLGLRLEERDLRALHSRLPG